MQPKAAFFRGSSVTTALPLRNMKMLEEPILGSSPGHHRERSLGRRGRETEGRRNEKRMNPTSDADLGDDIF